MTPQEFLKKLGLNKKQIEIYLFLASNPESSVVEISKETKIPRSTIYLELDKLIDDGLVTSQKIQKTKRYKIIDPLNLKHKINDKQKEIRSLGSNINNFVEKIEKLGKENVSYHNIQIYKGQAGVKQLLWNTLNSKNKVVLGYSPGTLESVVDREFAENWRNEFMNRNMKNKIILNSSVKLDWSDIPGFLNNYVEARTLEDKKIRFDRLIFMYDNTLVVISKKDDPNQYGIEIEDELLVQSYIQLFEFIWEEVAKEVG